MIRMDWNRKIWAAAVLALALSAAPAAAEEENGGAPGSWLSDLPATSW